MVGERPLRGTRVLLVDDCPDQQRVYLHLLAREGAEVDLECNGQSAIDTISKDPQRYDLVLMDLMMPEVDGLSATEKIREIGCQALIVAMTAFGSEELRAKWFAAGCDAFLEKPFPVKYIVNIVLGDGRENVSEHAATKNIT